jgi:hypothetical protein
VEGARPQHLEGRTCAFFTYGDDAQDERNPDQRPVYLEHPSGSTRPKSPRTIARPTAASCGSAASVASKSRRPLDLQGFGMNRKYSDNQAEDMARDADFMKGFDAWVRSSPRTWRAKGR